MKKIILSMIATLSIGLNQLLAMAPPPQGGAPQQNAGSGLMGMLMLLAPLFIVWYFFLIRPQKKREKEKKQMIESLKKGDKILTIGGIVGKVEQVKDDRVIIKVADKTNIEILKTAISGRMGK